MKRPEQHIIESKSSKIFQSIVPDEWVCREIKPDYGIDFLIEIFDNNNSTGNFFFVQLKGSAREIKDNTFIKQFSVDNLKYYQSLSLPVLIVCVSINTQKIWAIWANRLLEQTEVNHNQKSITISLNNEYLIDAKYFKKIKSQLEISTKVGFYTLPDSEIAKVFNEHLLRWIKTYYSESVSVDRNNLPKHLVLSYISTRNNMKINISGNGYTNTIEISELKEGESFLYRPVFTADDVNDYNKEILLEIAKALAKYDIKGSLKLLQSLIEKFELTNQNKRIPFDPIGLLILSKNSNSIHLFNDLVKKIIRLGFYELFLFFDLAYFVLENAELSKLRVENFEAVIANTDDDKIKGTCHYNIGIIMRPTDDNAIQHYFKAARLFPDYRNRHYWWKEITGLLFSLQHHRWAQICYEKSLSLSAIPAEERNYFRLERTSQNEKDSIIALIADCLFMQGKFIEAHEKFEKYFLSVSNPPQEWFLKNMACLILVEGGYDSLEFDRERSLKLFKESLELVDSDEIIQKLKNAIKAHPTNGLAWYNLGVAQDKQQMLNEACFSFIMTGLFEDGDKEAQFNALVITHYLQNHLLLSALLVYIKSIHGISVINDLSDHIMRKNITLEEKKILIKVFDQVLNEIAKKRIR